VLPLANLPSIAALAKLNSVGVFCFIFLLIFSYISAAVAGVDHKAFESASLAKPANCQAVFGIFSLAFFVHNCVLTIMRAAAYPQKNQRNLKLAYVLVWFCYASMGLAANLCPPNGNLDALSDPNQGKSSFLSIKGQPKELSSLLIISRVAVVLQSITVYPVLLYIIRAQVFSAFIFRRAYPGPIPVFILSVILAAITSFLTIEVNISDVLRFAGAFGCLICVYSVPSLVHRKESKIRGELTWFRSCMVVLLVCFGIFCVVMQVIPAGSSSPLPLPPLAPPPLSPSPPPPPPASA